MLSAEADRDAMTLTVAYIIGTYPLLTTTFIDREISLLQRRGVALTILSIRRPPQTLSPEQAKRQDDVRYLLPVSAIRLFLAHISFLARKPATTVATLFYLLTRPHPDLRSRLKTALHFATGVYAAYFLRRVSPDLIHAHFVDRATTVALVASRLLDIPYSATAHANDIYVNPVLLLEKMAGAKFVATCTAYNKAHLDSIAGGSLKKKVRLIYHGLDVCQYDNQHDATSDSMSRIVSVGQLKEKKGFTYLIDACRRLKEEGRLFDCIVVGEGPLRAALEAEIHNAGLQDVVRLCGAMSHQEVIEQYRQATVFTLPCILSANGDRDGIPNVILEAMAMGLPVVSTRHSGIPEVIRDDYNGRLVPPQDGAALAKVLGELIDDATARHELGRRARETVRRKFSVQTNVDQLLAEFLA